MYVVDDDDDDDDDGNEAAELVAMATLGPIVLFLRVGFVLTSFLDIKP